MRANDIFEELWGFLARDVLRKSAPCRFILTDDTSEDSILGGGMSPLDDADGALPSSLVHKLNSAA